MHILYVHQNFPAQFGHIAAHLVRNLNWRCTFVSETAPGNVAGIEKIQYTVVGGATQKNHFCTRTFENTVWHCDAVYQALAEKPDIHPDLIVGHSGFGSTLFLRELYPDVPCINFFEYYYHPHGPESDMDFRTDLGWTLAPQKYQRARCRNAMILLDLQNCNAGYAPTVFQQTRFPREYQHKLQVIFDGVDRAVYHSHEGALRSTEAASQPRIVAGVTVPAGTRIVTYVSRGFESMRGFDIFIRTANLIAGKYPDVIFVVVGADRMAYGGDETYIAPAKTFKQWVLEREPIDPAKFIFTGLMPPQQLALLLATTDLHIYLTVPFVLSWSLMNALSAGAVVLASDTPPVREMIQHQVNGLLADFFSPEDFAEKAVQVLKNPADFRHFGQAGEEMIRTRYSLDAVLPRMVDLYERTANGG